MAVDFRCENCGKNISAEENTGASMRCPHCQKTVTVPAALASLPRPLVPKDAPVAAAPAAAKSAAPAVASAPPPDDGMEELPEQSDAMMSLMARSMPIVLSIFFHVGLGMVMMFLGSMFATKPPAPEALVTPDSTITEKVGGSMTPAGSRVGGGKNTKVVSQAPKDSSIPSEATKSKKIMGSENTTGAQSAFAIAGAGQAGGAAGGGNWFSGGTGGGGPRGSFFGTGSGNGVAHHFVFVIDRSGSMVECLEMVKNEMVTSIAKLADIQDFHVILLGEGTTAIESPPKKLVPATKEFRDVFLDFIQDVPARGKTDPIPAMTRAFDVLERTNNKPGKIIFLLTDGAFPDNDKLMTLIRDRNKKKDVFINTYLYGAVRGGSTDGEDEASKFMKKVAQENHGIYKRVDPDE